MRQWGVSILKVKFYEKNFNLLKIFKVEQNQVL